MFHSVYTNLQELSITATRILLKQLPKKDRKTLTILSFGLCHTLKRNNSESFAETRGSVKFLTAFSEIGRKFTDPLLSPLLASLSGSIIWN